jgi:hypothetical protein
MRFKDITESSQKCPHCGGPLVEYSGLMEKKDACYYKVKASAKVWPSAYASGRLVQCRKKGAANYGNKSEGVAEGDATKKLSGATPAPAPNPYLKDILMRHIDEVRHFVNTGYIDPTRPMFEELYEYFANEIPDSVRRNPARLERRIGDMIAPHAKFYTSAQSMNEQGVAEDSLNEFAPGAGGDDEAGDDPYKYPKPKRYNRSADYFEQFEADHFDREDFDDDTGVFKGYWGSKQIAYFKFDNPARTGGNNSGMGWYYEPQLDGRSDNSTASPAVDNADERKQQELSMIRAFLKSGNRPNPDSQIGRLMKKHGMTGDLNEFAPPGSGDGGDDGFSDDTLKRLAAQWWQGDEDPRVEQTLAAAGWEIGQDEGYDEGGVFVVRAGDVNGNSYISWPATELEGLAESLGNIKMNEKYNPEYDDEAGMADNNLETLARAVEGIDDLIQTGDNLPEWCQEKIAVAKSMLVAVWDYMYSEEASEEVDPEIDAMFEAMDQLVHETAHAQQVSVDLVWESFESLPDQMLYETAAWRRKEGKSKKGGLNAKGVASYRRENPGSKLQMAVTTKPSKLKPGSKAAKRRKSFCARMSGVKGPMKKPNGKPTRKALALRKWNC